MANVKHCIAGEILIADLQYSTDGSDEICCSSEEEPEVVP